MMQRCDVVHFNQPPKTKGCGLKMEHSGLTAFVKHLAKAAVLKHLEDDVRSANELTVDENLGHGREVGPLADGGEGPSVAEDVHRGKGLAKGLQGLCSTV
jgi:hypothetical protein